MNYWVLIPPQIAHDKRLSLQAKYIGGRIYALAQRNGYCFATNQYFGDELRISPRTIQRYINELIDKGHIKRTIVRDKRGKVISRHITILWQSFDFEHEESHLKPKKKPSKYVNVKETKPYSLMRNIGETEFEAIAYEIDVSTEFVIDKWRDLQLYCSSSGKKYKNYYSALKQWVKRDKNQDTSSYTITSDYKKL